MNFEQTIDAGINVITKFDANHITIGDQRFSSGVIVTPDFIAPWQSSLAELSENDFDLLLQHKPELIILGTGKETYFPKADLSRSVIKAQIGLEVMTSDAACRTYNVLASDHRRVAALICRLDDAR